MSPGIPKQDKTVLGVNTVGKVKAVKLTEKSRGKHIFLYLLKLII